MRLEDVLPVLRNGGVAFHGAYMHKLDVENLRFFVDHPWAGPGKWMEIKPDTEMLCCDNWNLVGGPDWRTRTTVSEG